MHEHKFQIEGGTWACWGEEDSCGLRAPACFTPIPEACTRKGLIDLTILDSMGHSHFILDRLVVVELN